MMVPLEPDWCRFAGPTDAEGLAPVGHRRRRRKRADAGCEPCARWCRTGGCWGSTGARWSRSPPLGQSPLGPIAAGPEPVAVGPEATGVKLDSARAASPRRGRLGTMLETCSLSMDLQFVDGSDAVLL